MTPKINHIDQFIKANAAWLPESAIKDLAILNVMSHEIHPSGQAFVDHPSDPGGATNYGISLRFLRDAEAEDNDGDGFADGDYDRDGDIDADDIRGLSYMEAVNVYSWHFWVPHNINKLPPRLALKVFDMAVNMGPVQAIKIFQRILNAVRPNGEPALIDDGKIGTLTLNAAYFWIDIDDVDPFLESLRGGVAAFYETLVALKPKFKTFIKGWTKRAWS